VTVVGGSVIGISWTALFLYTARSWRSATPLPDVAPRVRARLCAIGPAVAQLGCRWRMVELQASWISGA